MFESQRVGVFVDVQNMFHSAKNLVKGKINYERFLEGVVAGRQLVRATAYITQKQGINQSNFHDALIRFGYDLRVKELRVRENSDGSKSVARGSWDVGMSLDIMAMSNKLDVVVLCAGNGEFSHLIEALKAKGIRTEVVGFDRSTAVELRKLADEFVPIEDSWWFQDNKNDDQPPTNDQQPTNDQPEESEENDNIGNRIETNKFGVLS